MAEICFSLMKPVIAERVTKAFKNMRKLDIEILKNA